MQTRRDQVQAHGFVMGRLVSALLRADPDSQSTPMRRFVVGNIIGLLLGGLVMAGFAVYGFFVPGGATGWQDEGALVTERETGARYVYLDGELRPVLNYASARLILGGEPRVVRVSRNSLRGVPYGLPIGIASAPDSLPDVERLDGTQWQVCSSLRRGDVGAESPFVTLWVGATMSGTSLGADRGLLVRTPTGQVYLAWNNSRLRVPEESALGALGYATAPQHPVGSAWVNALPAGPDLTAPPVPGRGEAGPTIEGSPTVVGQLFKVDDAVTNGTGDEYYVVRSDGLSPVTLTGAALLLADPATRQAYPAGAVQAQPLTTATLATAPRSQVVSVNPAHPARPPEPAALGPSEAPCVQLVMDADGGPQVQVAIGTPPPPPAEPVVASDDQRLADQVRVEPGTGLLIRDQPAPGVDGGALHLLVSTGVRYPLANDEVAGTLGYDGVTATPVPAALLALIPAGPPLDPEAAHATIPALPVSTIPASSRGPPVSGTS